MNENLLFWIYLVNSVILIVHEIDSAYWQEWRLINPKDENGIKGFLILHFPLIFVLLLGLVFVRDRIFAGYIISLLFSASGIFAFVFHFYHLKKGKPEFNNILSKSIIVSTFMMSIIQFILSIYELFKQN